MIRPLYIAGAAREVRLDGPAIRVAVDGRSDKRVPLRLLSRVVVQGSPDFSSAALVGCLSAGVAVYFLRPDGQPVGSCMPAKVRNTNLSRRLSAIELEVGGIAAFSNWAASEERRAILDALRRLQIGTNGDLRPEVVRRHVVARTGLNGDRADALWRQLEALLAAQLTSLLLQAGLSPGRAAPAAAGRIDLHGACLAAARWELATALLSLARHRHAHPDAWANSMARRRRIVAQYEALSPRIAASMSRRLRRLEAWIWERGE